MPQASPPRDFIDSEQQALPISRPRPRRKIRRSRGNRLLELVQMFGIRRAVLSLLVLSEMALLLIALVPQTIWAGLGYPNGPIPDALTPLVAGAFYLLPALTGACCRRWQAAIVLATLPAWLDLGVFAVAAAGRIGPFYLALDPHAANTVGTLELFAVLGALGWLARVSLLGALERRKGNNL